MLQTTLENTPWQQLPPPSHPRRGGMRPAVRHQGQPPLSGAAWCIATYPSVPELQNPKEDFVHSDAHDANILIMSICIQVGKA